MPGRGDPTPPLHRAAQRALASIIPTCRAGNDRHDGRAFGSECDRGNLRLIAYLEQKERNECCPKYAKAWRFRFLLLVLIRDQTPDGQRIDDELAVES